jgi:hypothetical protein
MKFTEHLLIAVLLAPTAALAAAAMIALAGSSGVPEETSIRPTDLAGFYADLERQP